MIKWIKKYFMIEYPKPYKLTRQPNEYHTKDLFDILEHKNLSLGDGNLIVMELLKRALKYEVE